MTSYKRLFEAKVDTGLDEDEYLDKLADEKGTIFEDLSDQERSKFFKMHSSKQYNWKFPVHSTETEKESEKSDSKIKELKKQGWKVLMDDDQQGSRALILYKKK